MLNLDQQFEIFNWLECRTSQSIALRNMLAAALAAVDKNGKSSNFTSYPHLRGKGLFNVYFTSLQNRCSPKKKYCTQKCVGMMQLFVNSPQSILVRDVLFLWLREKLHILEVRMFKIRRKGPSANLPTEKIKKNWTIPNMQFFG